MIAFTAKHTGRALQTRAIAPQAPRTVKLFVSTEGTHATNLRSHP